MAATWLLIGAGLNSAARAQPNVLDLPPCPSLPLPALSDQPVAVPAVGVERQADVGSLLFVSDTVTVAETGLVLDKEATATGRYAGANYVITIPPISVSASASGVVNGAYAVPDASFRYLREKGDRHGMSKPQIGIFDSRSGATLRAQLVFGLLTRDVPLPDAVFHQQHCQRPDHHALRTEIRYGGAAKGVLTLQYREFLGGVARPAFSQDATFDLAEGKDISFRGVHLTVLATSNVGIRYVVTAEPAQAVAS